MNNRSRLRRSTTIGLMLAILAAGACSNDGPAGGQASPSRSEKPVLPPEEPPEPGRFARRTCELLPEKWIEYVYRGWDGGKARTHDIALVPHPPNYIGSITDTSHSGPYGFLQKVPLVFYGPGQIEPTGSIREPGGATLADVGPTVAKLLGFGFPAQDGDVLERVAASSPTPPKLVVTAVIDGGGWNVLDLWNDRWPTIKRLMKNGVSIENAAVGSSPSITPAVHTTLSTGSFPNHHKITGIVMRTDQGKLTEPFVPYNDPPTIEKIDPDANTNARTIADHWDRSVNNRALVGLVSPGRFQLGMMSFGASVDGGDKDIAAILTGESDWGTNREFYSMPAYVNDVEDPDLDAVDRSDGEADGLWRGHAMPEVDATPAFAPWENLAMQAMLHREGFGADGVTDLFYVNYKAPDKAGHLYNMIGPEQGEVIESVDAAVADMIRWLNENVGRGNYVFILTADHGQTPLEAGGWPIRPIELTADLNARFDDNPNGTGLVQDTSAAALFMNKREMRANEVGPEAVARFLLGYTLGENVAPEDADPPGFAGRENETIFAAAIPGALVDDVHAACTQPGAEPGKCGRP